jgi:hypothetical protein
MFAALENLEDNEDSRAWDTIKNLAKVSISHSELNDHKQWFEEEFSKLVD